jgi:sugar-specific transcriptional regulator TrmB
MVHIQAVPKQSKKVYKLLSESSELTAKQIAEELAILPNAVYRAMKPLVELGMAAQLSSYPMSYKASLRPDAMNWYLRAAAKSFTKDFGDLKPKAIDDSLPSITFIKDREHLLKIVETQNRAAKHTINYIVSGHRVPDSTVLSYRKATATGVKVRCIVQNKPGITNSDLEMYEQMGSEVRYLPNIGIRMFIYDGKTAVMTSYDETQSSRAFGIRFTYQPVAEQLSYLFEERWKQSEPVN